MYYQYLSLAKLSEYMESTLQSLYLFVNNKKIPASQFLDETADAGISLMCY